MLRSYDVIYTEDDSNDELVFRCMAEDEAHAREQASDEITVGHVVRVVERTNKIHLTEG